MHDLLILRDCINPWNLDAESRLILEIKFKKIKDIYTLSIPNYVAWNSDPLHSLESNKLSQWLLRKVVKSIESYNVPPHSENGENAEFKFIG